MKRTPLLLLLTLITSFSFAQKGGKAYAITGQANGNFSWTDIREIDLSSGKVINTIFENGKSKFTFFGAQGKDQSASKTTVVSPTSTMVAAAAYDARHQKLFFIPMRNGELRWLDMNSRNGELKFTSVQSAILSSVNQLDEANNFTRMTMGSDGNGYAITNDGNHLIRFTTGKKTVVTDLGNLVDAAASANGVSVHNKCSSWGGDIVADQAGKLYLFTAGNHLFKIDINSRVANYMGRIKNLAPSFTINGAAVDNDDNVIVSSANTFDGFYKVNIKDLNAEKLTTSGQVFNASDLANSNLLYAHNNLGAAELIQRDYIGNEAVSIYPNPVSGSQFKITFDNTRRGEYNVALTDLQGRLIQTKQVFVKSGSQVETMQLKTKPAGGMYMIKITDSNKKSLFSDKIVID
ncbi:MAG: T9SS type A sorting domain-containing protein [Ginsengibacter sp.]